MKTFKYLAKDPVAGEKKGFISAFNEQEGREQLEAFGLTEIMIVEVPEDFLEKQRADLKGEEADRSEKEKRARKKPREAPRDSSTQDELRRLVFYLSVPGILILAYLFLINPSQDLWFSIWFKQLPLDIVGLILLMSGSVLFLVYRWLR